MTLTLKQRAQHLRQTGKTYLEIQQKLNVRLPASTLSFWCKKISLSQKQRHRIQTIITRNRERARRAAVTANKNKRLEYLNDLFKNNRHLARIANNKDVSKIIAAMLYLAEGTKGSRGCLTFGNSDPAIISLFIYLLTKIYTIDIRKFRCTVQCRADANIPELEKFWSRITSIPLAQFYKTRVDPRTVGKISLKPNYKGVCKLDYFSAHLYNDLTIISEIVCSIAKKGR
ncbi:MAG: hypothetical protein UY79_C0010G0002 [Parcubacteria group bacterium GW2011_GWA2_53_21]|nr:MAG: hypothetical protein UY79_C0010G0002 [Parcubacteria group bacterium GW2011_GWA2_53_21]